MRWHRSGERMRGGVSAAAIACAGMLCAGMLCVPAGRGIAAEPGPGPVAKAFGDPFPPESLVPPGPAAGTANSAAAHAAAAKGACPALLDYRMDDLRGRRIDLCAFKGKVLLVVNTASFCGYTPQYRGLEALQERFRSAGLVVMGFPSNDFGAQEPGTNSQIQDFCEATYGVRFPMFGKVTVRGADPSPLFARLTALPTPQVAPGEIAWNFEKFLLDRDGRLIARFRSAVEPESAQVLAILRAALGPS
jgi:glutathione peroxidase